MVLTLVLPVTGDLRVQLNRNHLGAAGDVDPTLTLSTQVELHRLNTPFTSQPFELDL